MGYLWERFFPVATLALRVENDRLSPEQNGIIDNQIVAERFPTAQRTDKSGSQSVCDRPFHALTGKRGL